MRAWLAVLVLVATVLLTAGCGGSSSKAGSTSVSSTGIASSGVGTTAARVSTSGSGHSLTAAQLVARGDAICMRLAARLVAANTVVRSTSDTIRIAPQRAAVEQVAVAELSKLVPPVSMARDWQQIVAARRTVAEDLVKIGESAASKDAQEEGSAYESGASAERELAAAARRSGFKHCGQVG